MSQQNIGQPIVTAPPVVNFMPPSAHSKFKKDHVHLKNVIKNLVNVDGPEIFECQSLSQYSKTSEMTPVKANRIGIQAEQ